jgi:hypothetical protein
LPLPLAQEAERTALEAAERARAEAEALVDIVIRRRTQIDEAFYDIGGALSRLREKRLYMALGFARFDDLLRQRLRITPTHARKLIRITDQLTRASAVELGQERAAALVRLAAATGKLDSAETLVKEGISLPGQPGRVRPQKLSVRHILRALRSLRRAPRGQTNAAREAKKRLDTATESLRTALLEAGATKVSSDVSIRGQGTKSITVVVQLEVGLEDATRLAKLLGRK